MKLKKKTINYLRAAKKNENNGKSGTVGKRGSKNGKLTRRAKESMGMEDMEVESTNKDKFISLKIPSNSTTETVNNTGKVSSIKRHQEELKSLKEKDPEFFQYLQGHDSDLLHGALKSKIDVTDKILATTIQKALNGSISELKNLLSIFRVACIPSGDLDTDGNDDDEDGMEHKGKYMVSNPLIYENVMTGAIDAVSKAIAAHLDLKDFKKESLSNISKHPKWKKMQHAILSFFKSILFTLNSLSNNYNIQQQHEVSVFLIDSLESYIPFLAALPRLSKGVLKILLTIWSYSDNAPQTNETQNNNISAGESESIIVRGRAFLRIRQMAIILPGSVAEECFRSIYLKYAKQVKLYNEQLSSSLNFMIQSIIELYKTDTALAYQQSFLFIRQLALLLRTAFLKKTQESFRNLVSWQYLHCIKLFTHLLSSIPSQKDGLGALTFPLVQIIFGLFNLTPSSYYIPFKFHLINYLHILAANCQVFIPTSARIIELLEHSDLLSKPTPSTATPPNLNYLIKLPSDSITKVVFRDAIIQYGISLLRHDLEIYRYNVGCPEYYYLTIRKLKSIIKATKLSKWKDQYRNLVGLYEQYSNYAKTTREKLSKSPLQITEFEALLPPGGNVTNNARSRLSKLLTQKKEGFVGLSNIKSDITDGNNSEVADGMGEDLKGALTSNFYVSKSAKNKNAKKEIKNMNVMNEQQGDDDDDNDEDNIEVTDGDNDNDVVEELNWDD
eukprot:gene6502-8939_t